MTGAPLIMESMNQGADAPLPIPELQLIAFASLDTNHFSKGVTYDGGFC